MCSNSRSTCILKANDNLITANAQNADTEHSKSNNHKLGKVGEKAAAKFLQKKGYQFLAQNFRHKRGEVDIICKDGDYIVFVEVKTRTGLSHGHPKEAVTTTKQKRVTDTALYYLSHHGITDANIRFDVVEILVQDGQVYASHIENAF